MSRDQWLILASVLIPIAFIALGMALGWRALRRRQSQVGGLAPVPAELGAVLLTEDLLYVSTTPAERPLERIAVHGLGFRARAVLTVAENGIVLHLAGEQPGFLAKATLLGVGRASWTIDRAVSDDGLVFVRWSQTTAGGEPLELDSNFRSADPDALVSAIERIAPAPATPEGAAA